VGEYDRPENPQPVGDGAVCALIAWGGVRGNKEAVSLPRQNLDQEKNADALLTRVTCSINVAAAKAA
jgi:ferritin-like metal-binding protein YciE